MDAGPDRVVAVVQARHGSTRLPGKVLEDLDGAPLLQRVLDRVRAANTVDDIVVATTEEPGDDAVADLAQRAGVRVHRGSTDDVLARTHDAAAAAGATIVVRITADDPFKDPAIIDRLVRAMQQDPGLDYISNTLEPTFPEGIDVECVRFAALAAAHREATRSSDREHVTPFIWRQPERFAIVGIRHERDLSAMRWTIDHPDDLELARAIQGLLPPGDLSMEAVLAVVESHPELAEVSVGHVRNEGYQRSIAREEEG